MPFTKVTEREMTDAGVSSLPLTPTASPAFGGKNYTPAQMKAAFDRLPRLIAERLNEVIASLLNGEILAQIPFSLGDTPITLAAFCDLLAAHLDASPDFDASPTADSANVVTSGGIYAALRAQKLAYNTESGILSLAGEEGEDAYTSVVFPIPALEQQVALLHTLMGASVLVEKTVDTFASRETAGGLAVVDNSPTTVHRIAGDTRVSSNIFDLSVAPGTKDGITYSCENNTFTISGTLEKQTWFMIKKVPDAWYGKTITFSQYPTFDSYADAGCMDLSLDKRKDGTVEGLGSSLKKPLTMTFDDYDAKYYMRIYTGLWAGKTCEDVTISFMVNEGSEALPYSDYYAGMKNAAFQGITSTGRNLLDLSVGGGSKSGVNYTNQNNTFTISGTPEGEYVLLKSITLPESWAGKTITLSQTKYFDSRGTVGAVYFLVTSDKNGYTNHGTTYSHPQTITIESGYHYTLQLQTGAYYGTAIEEETISYMVNLGSTALPYEDYIADDSFHLDSARQLRKWDYIDVDTQTLVTATADADFSSVTDAESGSESGADGTTTAGRYYWALCDEGMVAEDFTLSDIITDLSTIADFQSVAPDEKAYLSLDTATRSLILLIPASYGENGGTWVSEQPEVYAVFKTQPVEEPMNIPETYSVWEHGTETVLPESDADASIDAKCTVTASYYVKAGGDAA